MLRCCSRLRRLALANPGGDALLSAPRPFLPSCPAPPQIPPSPPAPPPLPFPLGGSVLLEPASAATPATITSLLPEGPGFRRHPSLSPFRVLVKSNRRSWPSSNVSWMSKGLLRSAGIFVPFVSHSRQCLSMISSHDSSQLTKVFGRRCEVPCFIRAFTSTSTSHSSQRTTHEESRKDLTTSEDPFDAPTYNIPEKPVTFAEGASYSVVILLGLGIAAAAAYAVFKELIFEPKEYKIYGKALERVQNDSQVRVRIGSPVTGYGQETRNRAARQRIPHKTWTDEDGVERVEVSFFVRGPHGAGKVYSEMFRDKVDKQWKFTYLIVDILSPSKARLMLESYVPA